MERQHEGRAAQRLIAVCLLIAAFFSVFMLSGCGQSDEAVKDTLTEGIEEQMAELTSLDSASATELFASDYTNELIAAGVDPLELYGPMFANLSYTIDDIEVNGDEAVVTMTVTNKNLTSALQQYTATITNELATSEGRDTLAALDDAALTRHMADVLIDCLTSPSVGTTVSTVDLVYNKDGSDWVLWDNSDLVAALLGGLDADSAGDPSSLVLESTVAAAEANVASIRDTLYANDEGDEGFEGEQFD